MKRQTFTTRQRLLMADSHLQLIRRTFAGENGRPEKTVITLAGYAILWNQLSSDRGGYVVRLKPGSAAFTAPALALYNHRFENVLGSTANGTLRIGEADDLGVPVEIDLPDTSLGRDVAELVDKKFVTGMSFSMVNGFESYTEAKEDGKTVIDVTRFTVDEVTVTPIPAFVAASVGVKDPDGVEPGDGERDRASRGVAEYRLRFHRLAFDAASIAVSRA